MSALAHHHAVDPRPHLYLVPDAPAARLSPAVYRRRRLAAAGIALLVVVTMWAVVQSFAGVLSSSETTQPMQTISASQPVAEPAEQYWTVRPGDTLWSIAQAVTPKGDIRPVLKRLDDRYGTTPLVAGQSILVS
jgi:LysM repeat protein